MSATIESQHLSGHFVSYIISEMRRENMHRKTLHYKLCLVVFHIDLVMFAHSALEKCLGPGSNW